MLFDYMLDSLRYIEPDDNQCHGSYVTELEKYDLSWGSNHTPSTIRAGFLNGKETVGTNFSLRSPDIDKNTWCSE
jgi:hypothetical protein